jgi:murein L,D-transpeptidase YcbB/YkuD
MWPPRTLDAEKIWRSLIAPTADLAEWVLSGQSDGAEEWTSEKIADAMRWTPVTGPRTVALAQPIPVFVIYHTAVVGNDGDVRFFNDVYQYDAALSRQLAALSGGRITSASRAPRPRE